MKDKRTESCKEVIEMCRVLLDDSIAGMDGCRRLSSLRREIDVGHSAAFNTFSAVDSETDDLPFGEVRALCSLEWLEKADAEIAASERLYREPVREAANILLRTLSTEVGDS